MNELDFLKVFYEKVRGRDSFVTDIDAVLSGSPRETKVTSIPFSTTLNPATDFPLVRSDKRKVKLLNRFEGLQHFELQFTYEDAKNKHSETGRFFVYEHPTYDNVFVAITIESSRFVNKGLLRFLRAQSPQVVIGFVPHARLKRLLESFQQSGQFDKLVVTRASQRIRLPKTEKHRRAMPMMSWPNMPLDEAVDWLIEHDGWFHSVQFEAKRGTRKVAHVSITREGVIRCDYLYDQVFNALVLPVSKLHHENFNLFSKRSRRDNPDLLVSPLAIEFDEDRFEDVGENKTFIEALRTMQNASISVLHGNPYIHLSAIDYLDGSTFDVWVVQSREVVIVPQMYASVGAIKRLVNHIFDTFAEGEVVNFRSS